MASSPKSIPIFFLLTSLLFSLQALARDSQFFSKVTRESDENTNTFYNTNNNVQETQVKVQAKEEEPAFLPQTTQNAYGLYGRETTTTKNNQPQYELPQRKEPVYYNNNNNNHYYNNNNMEKFAAEEEGANPTTTNNKKSRFNNYNYNYNYGKNYATELQGLDGYTKGNDANYYKSKNNYYYSGEQQGMSDTRFLENGKYFHNVNNEKPNNYGYQSAGGSGSGRPEYYNNNGYYSGSTDNFNRYYQNNRGMQGDQSVEEKEEFEFDP